MHRVTALLASSLFVPIAASPASAAPPVGPTDLALVMALARQCVLLPPHGGKGPDKVALDLTPIALGPDAGTRTWGVMFAQAENPPRSSVHVEIDPVARTCDGRRVVVPSPTPRALDLDVVLAGARRCASGAPWLGVGVGSSPLDYAAWDLQYRPFDNALVITFPEVKPTTDPSGRTLSVSLDGKTCGAVWMD